MKTTLLFFIVTISAHADWHSYQLKPSCGCWKNTLSFFNQDESHPFRAQVVAEREDTALLFLARFKGEAKMASAAGTFQLKSVGEQPALLVATFNHAGTLVAAKSYPLSKDDIHFGGPLRGKYVSNEEIAFFPRDLAHSYRPTKQYAFAVSHETAAFLPHHRLKFFGQTDLAILDILPVEGGDWILAGAFRGFGENRFAIFLQPGGLTALALFNQSSDDDPAADLFLARLTSDGETRWAREIWSRYDAVPELSLNGNADAFQLRFDPPADRAVFEPRFEARPLSGKGTYRATYSLEGVFQEVGIELIVP